MSRAVPEVLDRALELSRELLAAAERGDSQAATSLDAERLQLLKSVRGGAGALDEQGRRAMRDIALLNDQSIGRLEHHRRIKGRELDMAAVGRRAVAAYSTTNGRR
jgi:hypothetical protein